MSVRRTISRTKIAIGGRVHETGAIIGPVGEEVLEPRPAPADRRHDVLRARAVGDVGGGEVDHQQPSAGIDRDVALAPENLLARVETTRFGRRGLDRLAVDDCGGRAFLAALARAVEHQRDVVERPEQQVAHEAAEPPVDRLPRRKVVGQQAPAAAAAREVAQCVEHRAKIGRRLAPALRDPGQERKDERPFLVGQIGRVTLGTTLESSHSATALGSPHPKRESHPGHRFNPFSNGL